MEREKEREREEKVMEKKGGQDRKRKCVRRERGEIEINEE